ncbi:hypothetical protein AAFF_G00183570 [Aldrovandia affinis]|uniref:Uncharacterized protein n=1 Tax=Aldrovandia affinis TaxID=143900 RepID=A0AAD7RK38_9TELE|nr:hypothetical protein AAFF_G00183570 [Aldrovandia affinis]
MALLPHACGSLGTEICSGETISIYHGNKITMAPPSSHLILPAEDTPEPRGGGTACATISEPLETRPLPELSSARPSLRSQHPPGHALRGRSLTISLTPSWLLGKNNNTEGRDGSH